MSTSLDIEEGLAFLPKFDADGLVTAVVTDAGNGDLLMVAHMNEEALAKTIATGEAWYFSRSRQKLWKKGESSGHVQRIIEMRVDCDQDAVWLQRGAARAGRLPYRPALVLLPRHSARADRRRAARVPRRRQDLRSEGGLRQIGLKR